MIMSKAMDTERTAASKTSRSRRTLRVLISGASGFIGTQLRRYLGEAGHEVSQLVRREPDADPHQIGWDPGARRIDRQALEGFDAMVHLSGENIAQGRWTPAIKQRIRDSRVETTRLLAETAAKLTKPPRVLVCASAIGYYGDRGEAVLTESDPPGKGFLAGVCQEWEAATEPARAAGIRVVNLRIGVVLSPDGGAMAKMLPVFKMGMGGTIGSGNQWVSWIALSDIVRAIDFVIASDGLSGPVNAVSPKPVTSRQLTKVMGKVLNRPTVVPMPALAVRLSLGEMGEETLLASAQILPEKLKSAGFEFEYADLEQAIRHELTI
jgi:uncharacterized protein (TIGR01777 family)